MLTISAIALSLSLMLGAQAPTPAPLDSTPAVCHEEDACWDADSMGNGTGTDSMQADAWDTLDASGIGASNDTSKPMILTYTDTLTGAPANLPTGYFTVESNTMENVFHVFRWDTLHFA
jgi:hypothetical protein